MKQIICIAMLFLSVYAKAGSCSANGTGNWETNGTWSCGHVPGAGDNVTIGAGFSVTVTANNGAQIGDLTIFGTLVFTNGAKINLGAASVVNIFSGGSITGGNGGAKLVFPSASYSGSFSATGPYYFSNGGSGTGLLSLNLVSFECTQRDYEVILYWKTENEDDINSFEVESSENGNSNWNELETIPSMATEGSGYSYTFIDPTNLNSGRYYRLKIFGKDGRYDYSKILFINSDQTSKHSIALTLTYGSMKVILPESGTAQLSIFNASGQLIKSLITGNEICNIDISSFSQGVYFLRVSLGKNFYTKKFFKQ